MPAVFRVKQAIRWAGDRIPMLFLVNESLVGHHNNLHLRSASTARIKHVFCVSYMWPSMLRTGLEGAAAHAFKLL